MKLFEHPDFEQAILQATEHFESRGCARQSSRRIITLQKPWARSRSTQATRSSSRAEPACSRAGILSHDSPKISIFFLTPSLSSHHSGKMPLIGSSNASAMRSVRTPLSPSSNRKARPLVGSDAMTASRMYSASAVRAKSRLGYYWSLAPPAVASRPRRSSCVLTSLNSSLLKAYPWGPMTNARSRCDFCISGVRSSRSCLRSTAKSKSSSATAVRSGHTLDIITTCFNWQHSRR